MAYWKNREGGHHVAAQKEFVCDATTDLDTILTDHSNLPAGAKALVIETGGRYMLNSDGEWILQSCHSGGGSGSSGSDFESGTFADIIGLKGVFHSTGFRFDNRTQFCYPGFNSPANTFITIVVVIL